MKNKIIIWGIISLLFAGLLTCGLVLKMRNAAEKQKQQEFEKLTADIKVINNISLIQIDDGLGVTIEIFGRSSDKYQLAVELESTGYVEAKLIEIQNEILLKFEKQSFNFRIPFEELASVYRKEIINYIPAFERKFFIDEVIKIKGILKLVQKQGYSEAEIANFNLKASEMLAIARFTFACYKDKCEAKQESPESRAVQAHLNE